MIADTAFTDDGVEYPAGTAVISMYQAKRSVANSVLYDGTAITEWPVLYSEGITAFNYTRGFDMITCAEPAAYEVIAAACSESSSWTVASYFAGETGGKVIITNASEDSTAAVNALLQAGKSVSLITEGDYMGSFLCDYADYESVADDYLISAIAVEGSEPDSCVISKAPVIYISGKPSDNTSGFVKSTLVSGAYQYNYDRQAMELLGFTVTDNAAEADLIIGAAALDDQALAAVQSGTAYIGYGSNAIRSAVSLFEDGDLVRETVSSSSMDALAYVTYPTNSLITASYVAEGDDVLYGYGAGYFAAIPDGAQVLVQIDGSREPLEGFLCSDGEHYEDFLNDSIQAISYKGEGKDGATLNVVLFANTLTNKVHQRDEFNFISNAAWVAVLDGYEEPAAEASTSTGYTDVPDNAWYADAVAAVTEMCLMNGITDTTFEPSTTTNRAMLVTVLFRMAGTPETASSDTFTDVTDADYFSTAVAWASAAEVVNGTSDTTFSPRNTLTRQEAVTMFYRYAQSIGADVSASADLSGYVDAGSVRDYAEEAMAWAVATGLMTGTTEDTLSPAGSATRAELATMLVRFAESVAE